MRKRLNKYTLPFSGFSEMRLWKERKKEYTRLRVFRVLCLSSIYAINDEDSVI